MILKSPEDYQMCKHYVFVQSIQKLVWSFCQQKWTIIHAIVLAIR